MEYNSRMTLPEFFLKQKQAIRARSEDVFRLLRPEHLEWGPGNGALNIGEMLRHLWVSEEGVRRVALDGNFAYYEKRIRGGLPAVLEGAATSIKEELRQMARVHQETLTAVSRLRPEDWEMERENDAIGFRRKVSVILFGINEHEVHHRAQLMTYLRMLGTPAPEPFAKR
ncbi:MAG: DinB family protein [Candidatus Acidiferrales bacterium]